jgi:hypothetical protein
MTTKKVTQQVSAEEIAKAAETLQKLVLSGKSTHMRTHVQTLIGGLALPEMVKQGLVDANDPGIKEALKKYSRARIKKQLSPEPVEVPVEVEVETVVHEQPVYRRLKVGLNKQKRKKRALDSIGRDVLIRWWNANQRLIPKDDPVCVTLTDQINAIMDKRGDGLAPLSPMQIAGYFSHLCRMGLRTVADRKIVLTRSVKRGNFTVVPRYSQELIDAIKENWERERANEQAMVVDHRKLALMRINGVKKPLIADY